MNFARTCEGNDDEERHAGERARSHFLDEPVAFGRIEPIAGLDGDDVRVFDQRIH